MSFQAYLDNIQAKTGKTPDDFRKLAGKKGFLKEGTKAGEVVAWLKNDFGLGHGHAMAIYTALKGTKERSEPVEKAIATHFDGRKLTWKPVFETLLRTLHEFGDDVTVAPAASYLSLLRGKRKIAIVQVMVAHLDIGIKLKGVPSNKRFEPAGSWNTMMTHRVRVTDPQQIDKELLSWLRSAYEQNA